MALPMWQIPNFIPPTVTEGPPETTLYLTNWSQLADADRYTTRIRLLKGTGQSLRVSLC